MLVRVFMRKPKELHMIPNHRYEARFQFKVVLSDRGSHNRWSISFRHRRMIVSQLLWLLICRSFLLHVDLLSVVRHLTPVLFSQCSQGSFYLGVKWDKFATR